MAKDTSETELQTAPEPMPEPEPVATPPPARVKTVERQGVQAVPFTRRYPQVRGGICEWCGVMDNKIPSQFQYKLCPHFRGMELRCSYCDEAKDPDEVIGHATLNVAEHPDNPDKLVVWCNSYTCSGKHEARFDTSKRK